MKKLKSILNFLSRIFVRLAHVFEHLTCEEVPPIDFDDKESDS